MSFQLPENIKEDLHKYWWVGGLAAGALYLGLQHSKGRLTGQGLQSSTGVGAPSGAGGYYAPPDAPTPVPATPATTTLPAASGLDASGAPLGRTPYAPGRPWVAAVQYQPVNLYAPYAGCPGGNCGSSQPIAPGSGGYFGGSAYAVKSP